MKYTRVDHFAVNEFHEGNMYGCSYGTAMKELTFEWTEGVTNVEEVVYTLGEAGGEEKELDVCTYEVDGVDCRKCKLCDDSDFFHPDGFEADCSNIVPGAKTSCDDWYSSIDSKLFILQNGYVPPTLPPRTSRPTTRPPTTPPKTSSRDNRGSSGQRSSGTNEGLFVGIALVVIMAVSEGI